MENFIKFLKCDVLGIDVNNIKLPKSKSTNESKSKTNKTELMIKKLLIYHGIHEFPILLPNNIKNKIKFAKNTYINNYIKIKNLTIENNHTYFIHQLFGTQSYPDFIILHKINNLLYFVFFEVKSTYSDRSVWNSTLPKEYPYFFYFHLNKKQNKYLFFQGKEVMPSIYKPDLKILLEEIEKLVNNYNSLDSHKGWKYYPRKMFNQDFNYDYTKNKLYITNIISYLNKLFKLEEKDDNRDEIEEQLMNLKITIFELLKQLLDTKHLKIKNIKSLFDKIWINYEHKIKNIIKEYNIN